MTFQCHQCKGKFSTTQGLSSHLRARHDYDFEESDDELLSLLEEEFSSNPTFQNSLPPSPPLPSAVEPELSQDSSPLPSSPGRTLILDDADSDANAESLFDGSTFLLLFFFSFSFSFFLFLFPFSFFLLSQLFSFFFFFFL